MTAVFLDRDGVIIRKAEEGEYIADWSEVEFLPGALEAMALLRRRGFELFVATNQRGIATGKIQKSKLSEIHRKLRDVVERADAHISEIYCCPHDVFEECECRKPKPGMLFRAAREHQLELSECWMIGDSESDVAAGRNGGCRTGLVTRTLEFRNWGLQPDIWGNSLAQLARLI
jgi:D-glycero-D-manno-heptose 1,7-bisphosphate phosphatase